MGKMMRRQLGNFGVGLKKDDVRREFILFLGGVRPSVAAASVIIKIKSSGLRATKCRSKL